MASFTDTCGREWEIVFNMRTLKGPNILQDRKLLAETCQNPIVLADFLGRFLAPQLAERGITEDEFFESLDGGALEAAQAAILEAAIAFLPRHKADALRAALTKLRAAESGMLDRAMQQIEAFDPDSFLNTIPGLAVPAPVAAV